MVISFQITLLVITIISFMGSIAATEKNIRQNMTTICVVSITALLAMVFVL